MDDRWMQVCALRAGRLGTREARLRVKGHGAPAPRAWPRTPLATLPQLGGELASSVPAYGGGSGK